MIVKEWTAMKQKKFAPVYLVYGDEPFLIKETKQILLQHAILEQEMDFNFSSYDLEDGDTLELAMEDAETFPFMGERRVVFIHNPQFLTAEKKKEKAETNLTSLQSYLESPAPYTILVLIAPYEKLDERKKITKQLKKSATVLEAKKLKEHDIRTWVKQRAGQAGVQIQEAAAEKIVELAGTNLFMLAGEIDKLSLYALETSEITVEMVEKLTARSIEQNVFDLIDRAVHNRIDEALQLYWDLLKQKEEPLKILALLAGQFRLIYQVKSLASKGYGQQQIASQLKVHPFRVKLAAKHAQAFSSSKLSSIMLSLAQCDLDMKTSGFNKEMVIEFFLTRLHTQSH
ncbi:DNA polymerase III subunit delta [Jeotgalibacillus proteolyticus]|uniref:DNA polymerase III subunit delta n=1 Tax=Jeotgalibacillus proteolyticus TaxID=2082395 RepID=A0A2S5GEX8_9BACL|nr:DNA polymerase III subunit delta [Jeotgalibacillus proteolyticus]PPA71471.1 DNA polymerase III subunit delta [Jeotgalibacillus proteolyticus]